MKKLFSILMILSLMLSASAAFPGVAYGSPAAGDAEPAVPVEGLPNRIYLPAILNPAIYNVTGQVTGPAGTPLSGVTVTGGAGEVAVTNAAGVYTLSLRPGATALAAEKDGYLFTPTVVEVNVTGNLSGQNFSALAACAEGISNNSFEDPAYWIFSGGAAYSSALAHTGVDSARTGILNLIDNQYSYSAVSTALIAIPADTTTATLRMWLNQRTSDMVAQAVDAAAPSFGDATDAYDAQYVMILDGSNNLLETLMWSISNAQVWSYHEYNLSKWAGQTVKIQMGTYNDGEDGITSMYVDDVSLELCSAAVEPPDPVVCGNLLGNSGFELDASWSIPITNFPAAYSADYASVGLRSMRTGIPFYKANRYSYSDAFQTVTIPADATSATLYIDLLPMSEELPLSTTSVDEVDVAAAVPPAGTEWSDAVLYQDTAYILVLNPYTEEIIDWLWAKSNRDSDHWLIKSFDLMKYAGKKIRIQFGVYNDGYGGRSVMYVDEAYVDICNGTPEPEPEPPPVCEERVKNTSFETNTDWYIPPTAFSAGYSTYVEHGGLRSMRTGIKYLAHNTFSYSDFGQVIKVPSWANSAVLSMYLYNLSGEPTSTLLPEQPKAAEFGEAVLAGDVQYLLVLDIYGNWIDTLIWQRLNEGYWKYVSINLSKYAGHTIKLQWGTYNDGWGGVTSMFVDDVSLIACP